MSHHRDLADAWLRSHHGVITRPVLLDIGFTPRQADWFVRSQRLVAVKPGIYRSPSHPVTPQLLMAAACLAERQAWAAFTSAGSEWGFRGMSDPHVHILVPHHVRFVMPGVVVHRCRRIDPVDVTEPRSDGIRLTSPPRTLLDAAALIGHRRTASAIEQALAERRCTFDTLLATSRRLHHPRRPGARVFREVVLGRPAFRRAARSDLEIRMRTAIAERGMPAPIVNHVVVLPDGTPAEIDLAWVDLRVALEVDHPFWHDGVLEARRDKLRDRLLAAMGWLPQRVTEADIEEDLEATIDQLAAVLRQRGWAAGCATA